MTSRATQSELLEQRIAENSASQQVDLATWIFERVHVKPGEKVLELCCGTGGQTLTMLERVGDNGHVTALDISRFRARHACVESRFEKCQVDLYRVEPGKNVDFSRDAELREEV